MPTQYKSLKEFRNAMEDTDIIYHNIKVRRKGKTTTIVAGGYNCGLH